MPIYSSSGGTTSTVGDLVDRVYRDYLHPADDQPVIVTLAGDVDEDDTSWPYDVDTLAPDEEMLLAPGVLVEVGSELARIRSVDEDTDTLTVARGVNGTGADVHLTGDAVSVAPTFPRSHVVDAVKDNIVGLYPHLWRVATEPITTASTYVEVPESVVTVTDFQWLSGSRWMSGQVALLQNFPPSSTGKAIQFYGVPPGMSGHLSYRGRFERPETEVDALSDLGVNPEWGRIVVVGAAAQVVAGRDLDALTAEYITEQLQREALPANATQQVRNGLLTLYNVWIEQAHRNLRGEMPTPVVMHQ